MSWAFILKGFYRYYCKSTCSTQSDGLMPLITVRKFRKVGLVPEKNDVFSLCNIPVLCESFDKNNSILTCTKETPPVCTGLWKMGSFSMDHYTIEGFSLEAVIAASRVLLWGPNRRTLYGSS